MAVERVAFELPEVSGGKVISFPAIVKEPSLPSPLGNQHLDLYDSSKEGLESLPQLAKVILLTMVMQEEESIKAKRSARDKECVAFSARERASVRFLEFVAENEAMSKLSTDFLAKITKRSPTSILEFFKERSKKSA